MNKEERKQAPLNPNKTILVHGLNSTKTNHVNENSLMRKLFVYEYQRNMNIFDTMYETKINFCCNLFCLLDKL